MAEQRQYGFHAQNLANTAWASATRGQQDEQLFRAVARIVEQCLGKFNAQALARMAERHLDKFNAQDLANTAWAFAAVG